MAFLTPIKALTRSGLAIVMFVIIANFYSNPIEETEPPVETQQVSVETPRYKKEFNKVVELLPLNVLNTLNNKIVREIQCMALNNYYEAATEGISGMRAVSQVVMNRVDEKGFPSTVCGVVYHKTNATCQFSWVCSRVLPKLDFSSEAWKNAVHVAKQVYVDGETSHGLEDALFYHATYVNPNWNRFVMVKKVGRHIFYKKKVLTTRQS